MRPKRHLAEYIDVTHGDATAVAPAAKRPRRISNASPSPLDAPARIISSANPSRDLLSPLSDELLVRILSYLPLASLLDISLVSHRFCRLASDSQLWRALYYVRFVLPRAMRIPGFRDTAPSVARHHKLHYAGRQAVWADGRRGGLVRAAVVGREGQADRGQPVNWKRQYKIRHNWARGKCAVEELRLSDDPSADTEGRKLLVKAVEGVAITADGSSGLRAWDLKTRQTLAHIDLLDETSQASPSSIALDNQGLDARTLDIAIGFLDGSFGVWRFDVEHHFFTLRYRHESSSNGELIGVAYAHPYLLTATDSVLVSLYTFDRPKAAKGDDQVASSSKDGPDWLNSVWPTGDVPRSKDAGRSGIELSPPYLLTSLQSHTSRPPLALSIRRATATTIASIAYTFSTRQGWSIGIQDLHIQPPKTASQSAPDITTTRLAYTLPAGTSSSAAYSSSPPSTPRRTNHALTSRAPASPSSPSPSSNQSFEPGPTTLCYTHPYLLATLPDNTLILHLCTSTASSLSISPGIRLWGHTSGISDAEITAHGKAVSVSTRGEEMRVWELEGQGHGRLGNCGSSSVEIRAADAARSLDDGDVDEDVENGVWEDRRSWVGFDDEMVIVLKESRGRDSLMVYDFT